MTPQPSSYVNSVRQRIRERVARTSLRSVATAVGLAPNSVRGFLNGASPRAATIKKYLDYLGADHPPAPDRKVIREERANVAAAKETLLRYIDSAPARERARRLREVRQTFPTK